MKEAIEGPDCTNPKLCKGGCCSIKIDVPKILAEEYINRGYATKNDFVRSNIFTFQLRFNEETTKCFLFDKNLNGCSVHNSGIKPAQCWIYPTNFSISQQKSVSCKKLPGWKIISPKKAQDAEQLLKYYNFLCQLEAKKELREIKKRILNEELKVKELLKNLNPSKIAGIIDKWNSIDILSADGFSLQMKRFCLANRPSCNLLPDDFFECKKICNFIAEKLYLYLVENLYGYVKKNKLNFAGEYALIDLFNYSKF